MILSTLISAYYFRENNGDLINQLLSTLNWLKMSHNDRHIDKRCRGKRFGTFSRLEYAASEAVAVVVAIRGLSMQLILFIIYNSTVCAMWRYLIVFSRRCVSTFINTNYCLKE